MPRPPLKPSRGGGGGGGGGEGVGYSAVRHTVSLLPRASQLVGGDGRHLRLC